MSERIASAKYSGHVSDGGLQGHSVSAAYPWIIVGYGDDTWAAENACSGTKYPRRANIAEAQRDLLIAVAAQKAARELKARFGSLIGLPDAVISNAMRRCHAEVSR